MSIKVDIIAGFLGVGKTTLLNKLISVYSEKEKVALIENEFGEIGIDGDLLPGNLPVREIYAGCICCTLAGDFLKTIEDLIQGFQPERIMIEPSGVSQLSDILRVCQNSQTFGDVQINHLITIVDCTGFLADLDTFGDFYTDQIRYANIILLSHIDEVEEAELDQIVAELYKLNKQAVIISVDWFKMDNADLALLLEATEKHGHQDEEVDSSYQHVAADYMFEAWGQKDPRTITGKQLENIMERLKRNEFGHVLRSKGIMKLEEGKIINFNFTPGHFSYRLLDEPQELKVVVIGCNLKKELLEKIFSSDI